MDNEIDMNQLINQLSEDKRIKFSTDIALLKEI